MFNEDPGVEKVLRELFEVMELAKEIAKRQYRKAGEKELNEIMDIILGERKLVEERIKANEKVANIK